MYEDGKVTKTTPVSVALLYHQMSAIFKDTLNILLIAKVCIHRQNDVLETESAKPNVYAFRYVYVGKIFFCF